MGVLPGVFLSQAVKRSDVGSTDGAYLGDRMSWRVISFLVPCKNIGFRGCGTSQGASSHTSSPVHNIKQNKIPLVFRILTILHSSYPQQRSNLTIYTPPNNFILTTAPKGSSLPGSPFSLANFKLTIRPNPSLPKNLIPKHWYSLPCLAMGFEIIVLMATVDPVSCSSMCWYGRGALARNAVLGNMLLAWRGMGG